MKKKCINKCFHLTILLGFLGLSLGSLAAETNTANSSQQTTNNKHSLDRIVAIVNDSIITNNELTTQVNLIQQSLVKRNMPVPPENVLRKQVLEHMIDTELEMQMAKNAGIQVDSHDVDEAIENIAKRNNVSVEEIHKVVGVQGLTWKAYRRNVKKEIIIGRLQQKAVGSITVTDQEVENYLTSNARTSAVKMSDSFHIEDILIPLPADPTSQEVQAAEKRANTVLEKLKNGANFNELAVAESSGQDALQGGDLGFRQLPELPEAFATRVIDMKPGDLSQPIRTANGWHIIKLVAIQGGNASASPDKAQVKNLLYQRKYNEALENWMQQMRSSAYIQTFL